MSSKVHTLTITRGGCLTLHTCCQNPQWYTDISELLDGGVLTKLLERKVPAIKQPSLHPAAADQDSWLNGPITLKLGSSIFNVAKKCVDSHVKKGALADTEHTRVLVTALELIPKDYDANEAFAELMKLNEDDAAEDAPVLKAASAG